MREILELAPPAAGDMPPGLFEICSGGFREATEGIVLDALSQRTAHVRADDFLDRTGFECFVNSIHIDDYVGTNYMATAFLLVDACLARWREQRLPGTMRALVSCNEFGAIAKFHLARETESLLAEDLEGYEDPILVVDSDDKPLSNPEGSLTGLTLK